MFSNCAPSIQMRRSSAHVAKDFLEKRYLPQF